MTDSPELIELSKGLWSAPATGAATLSSLLKQFEEEMAKTAWPHQRFLAPPASREEIESTFSGAGLEGPEELVALYSWHNGFEFGDEPRTGRVLPVIRLATLSQAAERTQFSADPTDPDQWWGTFGWWPIENDNRGYWVSCLEVPDESPQLQWLSDENPLSTPTRPRLKSLCTLVIALIGALRSGGLRWEGNRWIADPSKLSPDEQASGIL